jgi:hypothetical protein
MGHLPANRRNCGQTTADRAALPSGAAIVRHQIVVTLAAVLRQFDSPRL